MWQNAANGSEKLIGDSLRANPDNLITSLKDLDKRMMTGCCAFTFVNNFLKFDNICSYVQINNVLNLSFSTPFSAME